MSETENQPYEDTLSVEQLRREVREAWDDTDALMTALRKLPEVPPYRVLLLLSQAAKDPEDWERGKAMQRALGTEKVFPKSEAESGAGLWWRIRRGLLPK